MNTSHSAEDAPFHGSRDEVMTALFASLVMQQSNMAMMMLGKVAHPETGKTLKDIEGARYFIDQLEMLEARTKGNLTKDEEQLLKQNLMSLRLTFVEAVESSGSEKGGPASSAQPASSQAPAAETPAASSAAPAGEAAQEESHKKFTKKY